MEHYDVTGLTYEQVTTNPFDAALAPSISVRRATGSLPSLTLFASDASVPSSRIAANAGRSGRVRRGR